MQTQGAPGEPCPRSVFTHGLRSRMAPQGVSQRLPLLSCYMGLSKTTGSAPRGPPRACPLENAALAHSSRPVRPWQLAPRPFPDAPPTSNCSQGHCEALGPGPLQTPLALDASPGDLTTSPRLVFLQQWFLPPPSADRQPGRVARGLDQGPGSPHLSPSSGTGYQQGFGEFTAPL